MSCLNCGKEKWENWKVDLIARENQKIANRICCSEKCFLEWWQK